MLKHPLLSVVASFPNAVTLAPITAAPSGDTTRPAIMVTRSHGPNAQQPKAAKGIEAAKNTAPTFTNAPNG
jgi:hypothetical protein